MQNPLTKATWDRLDIMPMLVLLQASSGRSGEDAVERARDTLHALEGFFVKARKP